MTNGWLDVGSSITSGVHFANGSTLTRGSYLVAAHVNSRDLSLSPFAKLSQVEAGTLVWVTDGANVAHRYVVVSLDSYDKQELPTDVFDSGGASQLVLVTCGGEISTMPNGTRQYAQNVVVRPFPSASPERRAPPAAAFAGPCSRVENRVQAALVGYQAGPVGR